MKKIKSEKGAITALVLVSMLFFTMFLISTYVIVANRVQTQKEIVAQTKKIYDSELESAEEIYNSYFENSEKFNITEENYVRSGLICWLDGINNTRNGHSTTTTVWEDLSGNTNDFNLNSVIIGNDNIQLNGINSFLQATEENLTYKTIEIVIYANNGNTASIYLGSIDKNKLWYKTGSIGMGTSSSLKGNISSVMGIQTKNSVSAYLESSIQKKIFINGEEKPNSGITASWQSNSNFPIIGRYGGQYKFSGNIYSIRMYNRELTEEEISQNYQVDVQRFIERTDNTEQNKNIIPIYSVEQLLKIGSNQHIRINQEGGKYYYFSSDSTYVLMNDLEFDVDNYSELLDNSDWIPIGARAIKFIGNGKSISVISTDDSHKVYDEKNNYSYNLTYVEEGLICWLDGINNTRNGHSTTTTVWEDLSGNTNDFNLNSVIIGNDNIQLNGINSFLQATEENLAYKTIEIVIYANNGNTASIYLGSIDENKLWYKTGSIGIGTSSVSKGNISSAMGIQIKNSVSAYLESSIQKKIFINGEERRNSAITATWRYNSNFPIIGKYEDEYKFNGNIYSIRMYNRELTEEEIKQNYYVDYERFQIQ